MAEAIERVKTYVHGLDDRMEGGVPKKFITLICGHAGTMKSSLGFSMLYGANREHSTKGVYLTLEQSKQSILEHMAKLGMDPSGMDDLVVIDLARVRKDAMIDKSKGGEIDWLKAILTALRNYKDRFGCEILVFDSLAALYAITNFKNPRAELFYFFEQLRDLDITTFLISEMPTDKQVFGLYGVEDFLSDGIIHLKVEQLDTASNLYIGIVKMRKTAHSRGYSPLIFESGRFEIVTN